MQACSIVVNNCKGHNEFSSYWKEDCHAEDDHLGNNKRSNLLHGEASNNGVICLAVDCNFTQKCWGPEIRDKKSNRKSVTEDVSHLPMSLSNFDAPSNMLSMVCEIRPHNK